MACGTKKSSSSMKKGTKTRTRKGGKKGGKK